MASAERSKASSERQNWETTYLALIKIMKTQHSQLGKLVEDRKIIVDHVKKLKERWAEEVGILEDQMAQVVTDFQFERAKADKLELILGLKESEAFVNGFKLECADSEIEGFEGLYDLYCKKLFDSKEGGKDGDKSNSLLKPSENPKEDKQHRDDVRRLKQQYDKLVKEKNTEVSALVAQKNFVWNQIKIMESDYTSKLQSKNTELEQAEAKIPTLLGSIEQLQSVSKEKDDQIAKLISKISTVEADAEKVKEEISRLSRELDLARKSASASSTLALNRCTSGTRIHRLRGMSSADDTINVTDRCTSGTRIHSLRGNSGSEDRINVTVQKDSSAAQLPEPLKDTKKGSKRNGDDAGIISSKRKKYDLRSNSSKINGDNAGIDSSKRKIDDMGRFSSKKRKGDDSVIISSKRKQDDVGSISSKRKGGDDVTVFETPKLFSSRFKIPKLKNTSPGMR